MRPRVMLDTGALIALERGQHSIRRVHRLAFELGYPIVATTPVIAEWWRNGKREKERIRILRTLVVEPPDGYVARLAGAAIGLVAADVVDALVMASASLRGDTVYTCDMDDLARLRDVFPGVQLERV
ncbi:MAG TPA: PIN domain-containing protein [Polyangiaceae bacterium]|nr:PIN domain-containing protein [Polyangiaceae bacterium]